MAAPLTTDEFVQLVRKSALVHPERLEAFLVGHATGEETTNPQDLAGRFIESGLLTRFQSEQLLQGKYRGFSIGKYKVLECLGCGGMGTVYLCEHLLMRRKVAVKVLPTARADSPAAVGRFYREARAAGVLDHPNLVKAHDVDEDNGLHFLVMDYLDGSSLQEIVSRFGPLPVARAANYVRQAALGLDHAFRAGLVHRDIKPANILLERNGTVRVLDLGLARFFNDQSDPLTMKYDDKNVLGTADYVAPEQALNSHEVDTRADVYSLGCTFYFLLTGRPPFPEGRAAQKLIAHQVKQPKPVRQLRPEVPAELAAVVDRMMAKKPGERFQTPGEVAQALAPWAAPVPPPAEGEMPHLCPAAAGVSGAAADVGPVTPQRAHRPQGLPAHAAATAAMPQGRGAPGLATPPPRRPPSPSELPSELATPRVLAAQVPTETDQRRAKKARPAPAPTAPPARVAGPRRPALHPNIKAIRLLAILLIGAALGVVVRWTLVHLVRRVPPPAPPAAVSRVLTPAPAAGTFTVRERVGPC